MKKPTLFIILIFLLVLPGCSKSIVEKEALTAEKSVSSQKPTGSKQTSEDYLERYAFEYETTTILELLGLSSEQTINFAGWYIEKSGIRHICLVYASAKNIPLIELKSRIAKINKKGDVAISNAKFSLDQLNESMEKVTAEFLSLREYGIAYASIDEHKNKIIIGLKKKTPEAIQQIYKLIDPSMVAFELQPNGVEAVLTH